MEFEPAASVNESPKFVVKVLSALSDLKWSKASGSSAPEIAAYICANYDHDGDVLSQVKTALKRSLKNKIVQINKCKRFIYSGPIASIMRESDHKNKNCRYRKNKRKERYRTNNTTFAEKHSSVKSQIKSLAERTNDTSFAKKNNTSFKSQPSERTNNIKSVKRNSFKSPTSERNKGPLIKCPECSKFFLLDWLKFKLKKYSPNW